MSHEIRTPMHGMLGMLSLLLTTDLTSEQRQYVQTAHNSGDSLLTLLNDILDLSKIEAGRLVLEHIPFDVRLTVEDVVDLMAERAHSKGVELACLISPAVPRMALPALLDAQRIDIIREILEDAFPEAVVEYIQSTSQHLHELHQAIAQNEILSISYVAHTLKGSCSNLDATRLAELCRKLMEAGKVGVLVDMTQHVAHIEAEFLRVRAALEHLCRVEAVDVAGGEVNG